MAQLDPFGLDAVKYGLQVILKLDIAVHGDAGTDSVPCEIHGHATVLRMLVAQRVIRRNRDVRHALTAIAGELLQALGDVVQRGIDRRAKLAGLRTLGARKALGPVQGVSLCHSDAP